MLIISMNSSTLLDFIWCRPDFIHFYQHSKQSAYSVRNSPHSVHQGEPLSYCLTHHRGSSANCKTVSLQKPKIYTNKMCVKTFNSAECVFTHAQVSSGLNY